MLQTNIKHNITLVFHNLDTVPDEVWREKKTVFLIGPSPRNADIKSYREGFESALASLDPDGEWAIFNPEGDAFDPTRGPDYALWELEMLERCSVIVIGLNTQQDTMPGLTTRVEAGLMLGKGRSNLVVWRPKGSWRTRYIWDRAMSLGEQGPICLATEDSETEAMLRLAQEVKNMHQRNVSLLNVSAVRIPSSSRSANIPVRKIETSGCDPAYLHQAVMREQSEVKEGSPVIEIWVPVARVGLYISLLEQMKCVFTGMSPPQRSLFALSKPEVCPEHLVYLVPETVYTFYHAFYSLQKHHGYVIATRSRVQPSSDDLESENEDQYEYHGYCEFDPRRLVVVKDAITRSNEWYSSQEEHAFGSFRRWRYHMDIRFLNGETAVKDWASFQPHLRIPVT